MSSFSFAILRSQVSCLASFYVGQRREALESSAGLLGNSRLVGLVDPTKYPANRAWGQVAESVWKLVLVLPMWRKPWETWDG